MGDDGPVKDVAEAIERVMTKAHKKSELRKMGMYDPVDGKFKPISSYQLSFDSQQNQLEPSYYWLLDFIGEKGWKWEKLIDNFMASPGSGQFSELNMKATKMQEEGMKILGGMNQVIKSVLNLVYDLKEFELRLAHYDDADGKNGKEKVSEGMLALKQIWLDNVDLKRGRGSIHQMSAELGYSTLREAFMMANSQEDLKKINKDEHGGLINDQVLRILIPRLSEFLKWVDYSEKELRKRFSIERNYLKSQVETIKLYSGWMKPYLIAAEKLRQQGFEKDAALVNAFSTTMFHLELFTQKGVDSPDSKYKPKRDYKSVMVIDFKFRGHVSQRVTQKGDYGYGMGGKINIIYKSYALNDEEIAAAKELLDKADRDSSLVFSADVASDALADLKEDLDYFLMSDDEKKEEEAKMKKTEAKKEDINPFSALFGFGKKKKEKKKEKKGPVAIEDIKKDNFLEKKMRGDAGESAASWLYLAYDIYKKAHRMASAAGEGFDTHDDDAVSKYAEGGDVSFGGSFKGAKSN
ncbi:hypothetical protein HN935_02760 [archaeon]|jgi:hypothetical protein|nr:hypothetical protein [archaeon]